MSKADKKGRHTYTQNGDLMRDPEMTFRVDREKGTMEPLTFRQDGSIQIYQEVYPEPGKWIPKLHRDLNTFAQQWLKNISEQGYHKREAVMVQDGEDVRLTFDQDGRAVEPAAAPAAESALGDNPTIKEIYGHYAPMVKNLVLEDRVYKNACDKWVKEYAELKELLTQDEYNSARSTVLNAHYTSPTVIKAMYQAVENMNFQPGTVLEPSMGIGNFFGLLPEKLGAAKLYGVELDDLTGRIS